jgi:predicted xylose isomerase-like sugar epimerase
MTVTIIAAAASTKWECTECGGKVDGNDECDCTRAAAEAAALAEIYSEIDAMNEFNQWVKEVEANAPLLTIDDFDF